ncbi:MAG TPA: flagellar hook-length control protein FliK, partial [Mobilitalea sp.]|nr:flagellar hook-length control protein FliK [Mobilitalea sp.]
FVNNLVKSTQEIQLDSFGNTVQTTELKEIVNQIVDRIKIIVKPEQTSMELQLNPEELGKVNLTIQSKNGVMTAQFVVQNEMSKEAIESQMSTLKETLNQQGIKVDAIDVTVASYTFEQKGQADSQGQPENQKNQSGRKLSVEDAIQMTDADVPEEAGKADISGLTGSNIDYTA